MTIKKILFAVLLTIISQGLMAQGIRISGTLNDNEGPVMMGNVVERDANNRIVSATQTDFNGNFSMQVKSTKNKLVFSYVGDKTKVINIGNQTVFNVTLEPENTQLKEVVVKSNRSNAGGLMMQKKEVSTSQQVFNMESVEGLAFTSADEALQGEIAGLDIVSNSGNLGSGTTMRLRGVTTISGDANPLIVVDDRIFDDPSADIEEFSFSDANEEDYASLLSVNVEDIASITVLKDAAATAIWGSRGSNGVIMITTKRGVRGKPRVNFSYKFTGTWQPQSYKLLNGDDYTMLMKEEFYNPSQSPDATRYIKELNYDAMWPEYQNWNNNTDWRDAVTQFGAMHDFNVNLSGGGQKATFRISAGYKHQTGSVIKQKFQQFTTRMALDYNVSDRIRFSTNFALTYTGNDQNYAGLLGIAQKIAPNMNIYRQNGDGSYTDEYYIMNPSSSDHDQVATGMYSSSELQPILNLGNPVAIAHKAWKKNNTYRLTPDFTVKYELLGVEAEKSRLTLDGRVAFDIFAKSIPSYYPASLSSNKWSSNNYNLSDNTESNSMKVEGRVQLSFTPYFKNQDWSMTMYGRYEMGTQRSNQQYIQENNLPPGITSPTVDAHLPNSNSLSSTSSRSAWQNFSYSGHVSYKDGRYGLTFTLRADGDSKFGPKNKWAYFPGASLRYNISDEPFFKPIKGEWLSMLGLRASWGIVGKAPSSNYLFYNTYNTSAGNYGFTGSTLPTGSLNGMKLDDLKWEKTTEYNFGFNLGFLDDKVEVVFDYYHKETKDLLMSSVQIPSVTGYATLSYKNVGRMDNDGWNLDVSAKRLLKIGKFSMDAGFNIAQNSNLLKEMDQSVLDALNTNYTNYSSGGTGNPWAVTDRGHWPLRVQLNNSLGSIYGYRFKGVYQYSYEWLENLQRENNWDAATYENEINKMLAEGKTFPIVTNADGTVLMDAQGHPKNLVLNYENNNGTGSQTYAFQGGDAIYEDINHDGQINQLDVVYLGNSLPKVNGGFNFSFKYGPWSVKTRFTYRFGNKVVNLARQNLEAMFNTYNQCATVNYRWRKEGDVTPIPRALYNTGYNFQASDRYVEDGGFLRFQNLQVAYNFDKKFVKSLGLNQLQAYASMNNLYLWTKYSGTDPEKSPSGYGVAVDKEQTPPAKSFTVTLNVGF